MPDEAKKKGSLEIVDPPVDRRVGRFRKLLVHTARLVVFVAILFVIRIQHQKRTADAIAQRNAPQVSTDLLKSVFPKIDSVGRWRGGGTVEVLDEKQNRLGTLIHTAAESKEIVGYVGSTYLLIALDANDHISGVIILESEDTVEHVDAVRKDEHFLESWNGLKWQAASQKSNIDMVSGATLTSIAIVQSLRSRLGGNQPSLKFPDPLEIAEVKEVFPDAIQFELESNKEGWFRVLNKESKIIGYFLRSSPWADHINGFQGPTDFLTFFDSEKRYLKTVIRSSYENMEPERYVDYVRDEEYFLVDQFQGLSLSELANYDEFNVEGASGATRTSEGVFRAMQFSVNKVLETGETNNRATKKSYWNLSSRDFGTVGVLLAAMVMTFSRLRHRRSLRLLFQIGLVAYLGFLNGDILSQTVLIGWVQNDVPWGNAVGLWVLTIGVFVLPILSKRNVYCHSVCPFGAAQSLAGKLTNKKVKLPKRMNKTLKLVPAILIGIVVSTSLFGLVFNLAAIEPFDAFSFWIAGWAALSIAAVGLACSLFVPMAYCKYGCPTGGLLEYVRRTGRSDRIGFRDYFALLLLGVALCSLNW